MKKTAFLLMSLLGVTPAYADDMSIIGSSSLASLNYKDADGETTLKDVMVPLTLGVEYQISKRHKLLGTIRQLDYDVDASTSGDMGMNVDASQINISWLRKMPLSREFKPWVGVGLRSSFVETTLRHTVDSDGFLEEVFNDTEDTLISINLIANVDWRIGRNGWAIDTRFIYDLPMGDGLSGFELSAGIKYNF